MCVSACVHCGKKFVDNVNNDDDGENSFLPVDKIILVMMSDEKQEWKEREREKKNEINDLLQLKNKNKKRNWEKFCHFQV